MCASQMKPPSRHDALVAKMRRLKTGKISCLWKSLTYLSLLAPCYAQALVGGDLSGQAPYGLPADDFAAAISSPDSYATFPIPGYDTSLPAGAVDATGRDIDGWSIAIGVAADVPLAGSRDSAIDRNLCIAATTLSIIPPANLAVYNSTGWRVCAVVFADGLAGDDQGRTVRPDGSCAEVLPDDCIQQLRVNSAAASEKRGRGCRHLDIPAQCADWFRGRRGTAYEITPIGDAALADRRSTFFAAASQPTRPGNRTALAAAEKPIWPVLLTWTHFSEAGDVHDSEGWLSCAKTTESKEVVGSSGAGPSGGDADQGARWAVLVLAGVVAGLLLAA